MFDLWNKIAALMERTDNAARHFTNEVWQSDLVFLIDINSHLNDLNKKLQGKDNVIHDLFATLKAFEVTLDLWINQFRKKGNHTFFTFVVLPNFKHGQIYYCAARSESTIRLMVYQFPEK